MKYTMTQDEFDALAKANPARVASEKLWQEMGKKYGFDWKTVRATSGDNQMEFTADPS